LFSLFAAAAGLVSIVVGVGFLWSAPVAAIVGGCLAVVAAVILYEPETESQRRDRRAKAHKA
jgi:hypothetical protein